ncbi:hypothetical protein [Embleya sp. NPDC059237]|uniref:hypothetical protein n=1 Tax=Embleya sp. NPDC059237 TaxID=3346784 RepID=UPI0036B48AAA
METLQGIEREFSGAWVLLPALAEAKRPKRGPERSEIESTRRAAKKLADEGLVEIRHEGFGLKGTQMVVRLANRDRPRPSDREQSKKLMQLQLAADLVNKDLLAEGSDYLLKAVRAEEVEYMTVFADFGSDNKRSYPAVYLR